MVQEAKSPVKNLVSQRCEEGYNSGVKELKQGFLLLSRQLSLTKRIQNWPGKHLCFET
jgi:hypothetical protein